MTPIRPDIDARLLAALAAEPRRVPVLVGPDRSGRTSALHRLADDAGPVRRQYVDLERLTSTPERFLSGLVAASPFGPTPRAGASSSAREALESALEFLATARAPDGQPATFLLDEWLEIKTFEHFPGLRHVVSALLDRVVSSGNRLVLTSRFVSRTLRALEGAPDTLTVIAMPPLSVADVAAELVRIPGCRSDTAEEFARTILALTGGRDGDARALAAALVEAPSLGDPISALVASLAPGAPLDLRCRYAYEYRLHRARGYGALKAVLGILAAEEPLTLSEIAARLRRTPGSARDYLWWLEDVDLVVARRKQYAFADPLLRLWVGLFDRPAPADDEARAAAVQRYALGSLSGVRS